jgi:hypothetical protein
MAVVGAVLMVANEALQMNDNMALATAYASVAVYALCVLR